MAVSFKSHFLTLANFTRPSRTLDNEYTRPTTRRYSRTGGQHSPKGLLLEGKSNLTPPSLPSKPYHRPSQSPKYRKERSDQNTTKNLALETRDYCSHSNRGAKNLALETRDYPSHSNRGAKNLALETRDYCSHSNRGAKNLTLETRDYPSHSERGAKNLPVEAGDYCSPSTRGAKHLAEPTSRRFRCVTPKIPDPAATENHAGQSKSTTVARKIGYAKSSEISDREKNVICPYDVMLRYSKRPKHKDVIRKYALRMNRSDPMTDDYNEKFCENIIRKYAGDPGVYSKFVQDMGGNNRHSILTRNETGRSSSEKMHEQERGCNPDDNNSSMMNQRDTQSHIRSPSTEEVETKQELEAGFSNDKTNALAGGENEGDTETLNQHHLRCDLQPCPDPDLWDIRCSHPCVPKCCSCRQQCLCFPNPTTICECNVAAAALGRQCCSRCICPTTQTPEECGCDWPPQSCKKVKLPVGRTRSKRGGTPSVSFPWASKTKMATAHATARRRRRTGSGNVTCKRGRTTLGDIVKCMSRVERFL